MYADIRDKLKTGDICLFGGWGKGLMTDIIKWFSGPYHHVALIVADVTGGLGLWESTKAGKGKGNFWGVQWHPLSDRLVGETDVFVRQLSRPMTPDELSLLADARHHMDGLPYERDYGSIITAARDGVAGAVEALDTVFCSELVAAAYRTIGWLGGAPASAYTPTDFSTAAHTPLPLRGIGLGPELRIA